MAKKSEWNEANISFSLGSKDISFKVYTDISEVEGPIDTLNAALDNWLARTVKFSPESFVDYVNSKGVHKAYTEDQWKSIQ